MQGMVTARTQDAFGAKENRGRDLKGIKETGEPRPLGGGVPDRVQNQLSFNWLAIY